MSDGQEKVSDQEWAKRILCSDEACIGVIGPDGRCTECGRLYEGELPNESVLPSAEDGDGPSREQTLEPEEQAREESGDEWDLRRLCSDENCIGVIGPDGRCKECGKPAE